MSRKTVNTAFTTQKDLLEELDEFVESKRIETDRNRSNWITLAIREMLKKYK